MGNWFEDTAENSFEFLGPIHIFIILLYFIGAITIIIFNKKLTSKSNYFIRWLFFSILFLSEFSYQIWGLANGMWNQREFLPFQLCSIAGIITLFALSTQNTRLIQLVFFIGIVPSLLAVITPELFHGFPHFRFWQFFIHHLILSWACIFLLCVNQIDVSWRIMLRNYIYLLLYAALVGFVLNPLFNANFLFLARTSTSNTPLNFLGEGILYYINLCSIGLISFVLLVFIYKVLKKQELI
ncbi:YwaF family protein [Ornithinibacillus halophilus]|uniref:Conserved hypothetical integral membrane protein TIGR02206 n=1 Tax=Ornithinibacillus halophilus TaxID=930117 RepID=A0A1M5E329_9BACI|nr:TIGR02206 family membrane protein [Ornithinibacillus halophilus]SHF73585.1 conserved hypothetical integral membrane protein TIGR02206 [Ornithinibacillus halophilus]